MEPTSRKSRRPSAGTPSRQLERLTLFLDRDAGGKHIVEALKAEGYQVVTHDDVFEQSTPDAVWIKEAARRNWVVITADRNISRHEPERSLFSTARVHTFILYALTQIPRQERIAAVKACLPKISSVISSGQRYGIYRVYREGHVQFVEITRPRVRLEEF